MFSVSQLTDQNIASIMPLIVSGKVVNYTHVIKGYKIGLYFINGENIRTENYWDKTIAFDTQMNDTIRLANSVAP